MRSPGLMLCRLGWHKASADGTWNQGYCFTACSRCGRDMVRSLFGEWHVPADFRVVWRAKEHAGTSAPSAHRAARPSTPRAAPPTPPTASVDPTREVSQSPFDFGEFDPPPPEDQWPDRAKRRNG